jgi:uncharacterized CHY-type Zn-finger protein
MTEVFGQTIDDQTRCVHYGTAVDIIAIKFHCCRRYYPCHLCHAEGESHAATQWPTADRAELAILCGECRSELSVAEYLTVTACPRCHAEFNEGCRLHSHYYFES